MPRRPPSPLPSPRPQVVALLKEIKDNPADDLPRLVLADWLDDHGEPDRARLIRVQCELSPLAEQPMSQLNPRYHALQREEKTLLARHANAWLGPLRRRVDWHLIHKGLLTVSFKAPFFTSKSM